MAPRGKGARLGYRGHLQQHSTPGVRGWSCGQYQGARTRRPVDREAPRGARTWQHPTGSKAAPCARERSQRLGRCQPEPAPHPVPAPPRRQPPQPGPAPPGPAPPRQAPPRPAPPRQAPPRQAALLARQQPAASSQRRGRAGPGAIGALGARLARPAPCACSLPARARIGAGAVRGAPFLPLAAAAMAPVVSVCRRRPPAPPPPSAPALLRLRLCLPSASFCPASFAFRPACTAPGRRVGLGPRLGLPRSLPAERGASERGLPLPVPPDRVLARGLSLLSAPSPEPGPVSLPPAWSAPWPRPRSPGPVAAGRCLTALCFPPAAEEARSERWQKKEAGVEIHSGLHPPGGGWHHGRRQLCECEATPLRTLLPAGKRGPGSPCRPCSPVLPRSVVHRNSLQCWGTPCRQREPGAVLGAGRCLQPVGS